MNSLDFGYSAGLDLKMPDFGVTLTAGACK